mgnify:CR=1 FL=1
MRAPARAFAFFACVLLACALALSPRAASADPAQRVYVGVYLRDVIRFDQRAGTFDVDMEVWVKWFGDFDPTKLRVANESSLTRDDLGSDDDDGWHVRRWRMRGTLRGEFPLHRFPFDDQTLAVEFELPERDATLVPDLTGSGMEPRFSVTGWNYQPHFLPRTARLVYPSDLGSLLHEGQDTVVHRARFEVRLKRPVVTATLKLFLPLVLILLVALVALFMAPELIDARSSIGVTALLACFAFQFTVAGTIPDVAYLTLTDALFIVSYAVTAIALGVSVAAWWLYRHERHAAATRLDRIARLALPLGAMFVTVWLTRAPPPAAPAAPPRLAVMSRPASARPVVRVGVSQLPTLMNSAVTWATRWGLVHTTPSDERIAFLAERAPAVGNDALHVHADGRFEVRWRLRDHLAWSDGHALTSDDVRFALEVSPDPHVVSVQTPDARTVVVTYDGVLASALDGVQPLPRHRLGETFKRGGYEAVTEARRTQPLPTTGPYRVLEFTRDRGVTLEANPHFIGPPPSIRRVEIRCVADHAELVRAFERGELDLVAPNALSASEADALGARVPGVVLQRPSNQLFDLQPDPSVPWLERPAVRLALFQAIDREAFTRTLFGAAGRVANVPVPDVNLPRARAVTFDPTSARDTLAREGLAGQTVRLTHANGPLERRAAELIAVAWVAAGLKVEDREVASITQIARTRAHGGVLLHTMTAERDTETRRFWNLPRDEGRVVLSARTPAYDNAVAELAAREDRALFPERKQQLRERLMVLFTERLPLLPLTFASERWVVTPALRGWDRGPGVRFGEGIEQWHFVTAP